MPTSPSYLSRVVAKAKHETALFTWRKLLTGLCMAVIVRIALWHFAVAAPRLSDLWRDLLIIVGSYAVVIISSSVINLVRAPALLDAECQRTIEDLSRQLEVPDKAKAAYLNQLLEKVGDNGKVAIRFLLFHSEEVSGWKIKLPNLSNEETYKALRDCSEQGLINTRSVIGPGMSINSYYWIPDSFRTTLTRILYGTNPTIHLPPSAS
jgi:hypothetical protein